MKFRGLVSTGLMAERSKLLQHRRLVFHREKVPAGEHEALKGVWVTAQKLPPFRHAVLATNDWRSVLLAVMDSGRSNTGTRTETVII